MKRRIPAIIALAMIMSMMTAVFAFAGEGGGFKITSSYPEDGQVNTAVENVGVKVFFSNDVDNEAVNESNKKLVKIIDVDGNSIPIRVLAKKRELLVLADMTDEKLKINNNSYYTLIIDPAFADNEGDTLGAETKIKFKTFNQTVNNAVNMGLMIIMMGGILVVTMRQTLKKDDGKKKKQPTEAEKAPFNPYREAKRTGKTVEEVIAEEEARKAKEEKKNARKNKRSEAIREKLEEELDLSAELPNVYRVKKTAPVSKTGSTVVSGRGKKKEEKTKRQQSKTRAKNRSGAKKK